MSVAAILVAALAVWLVAGGEPGARVGILIATALGASLSVLLAAAVMTLLFIGSGSRHDEQAHRQRPGADGDFQA